MEHQFQTSSQKCEKYKDKRQNSVFFNSWSTQILSYSFEILHAYWNPDLKGTTEK